jgi:glycosyltransferase involved in cell wall biosynthesis
MDLHIFKNNIVPVNFSLEANKMSFNDFKKEVLGFKILKNIFKYDTCTLHIYNFKSENYLFFAFCLMHVITKKKIFYQEVSENKIEVKFKILSYLFVKLCTEFFTRFWFLHKLKSKIKNLTNKEKLNLSDLNLENPPIYLNTNLWFGVVAGGSVGHIAGVLNNLKNHFAVKPIFFSTDVIPTVDANINLTILKPLDKFWDFAEMPTLATNKSFIQQFEDLHLPKTSFIYQRYSLNNFTGVELAYKLNLPLVLEYNGSEVWISKNWGRPLKFDSLSKEIELLNFRKADLIVVVSDPLKKQLVELGISEQKILVNPNGVDTHVYSPDAVNLNEKAKLINDLNLNEKVVLGFIGTFGPWHGAEILAQAFVKMMLSYPKLRMEVRLLMIGDGVGLEKVKSIINKENLGEYVTFTGVIPQSDGPKYLDCCDIFVSPHIPNSDGSAFFGSPTKLFEYMSMGKGIVASDLDQIGEILEHNKTAMLVPPGNMDKLLEALLKLIDDKPLRNKLGENARNVAINNFSWEIHTEKIINSLKRIINK